MAVRSSDVPEDVYIQFVRSLFESRHTLLIGALCHMVVALMAFIRTGWVPFAVISALLLGIGIWRFISLRHTKQEMDELDIVTARKWEFDYIVYGSIQGLVL